MPASFNLFEAGLDDSHDILAWRNHPDTRKNSVNTRAIDEREHELWFKQRLASELCKIYMARDENGLNLGMVRFDIHADAQMAEISIAIAPASQGQGLAALLLRRAIETFDRAELILQARVKDENIPSKKSFERNGFTILDDTSPFLIYQKVQKKQH